jgi:diamine N-acetyltransferase
MKLSIRKAGISDVKIICALGVTTFYEAYFAFDDSSDLAEYVLENFSVGQIEKELKDKNSTFFIAEIEKGAVGYAKLRENAPAECLAGENTIEIHRIYILEKMKGKRVGDALMKKCFDEARRKNYKSVWLGVWEENLLAQKFYQKYGFEKVGELQFPYADVIGTNYVLKLKLN